MSDKLAEVYVEIQGRFDKLQTSLDAAKAATNKATEDLQRNADKFGKQAENLTKQANAMKLAYGLAASIISSGLIVSLRMLIKSTAEHLHQLEIMSAKTGVSVEMLTSLELAAKQNLIPMSKLATAIRLMHKALDQANEGSKGAVKTFQRLGMDVKDSSGRLKSGIDAFMDVAEAISKIENPAQRSALAMKVFGRQGAEMLPILEGGREKLEKYIKEAKRLHTVFTDEDAKRASAYKDMVNALGSSIGALKQRLVLDFFPPLTKFLALITGSELPAITKAPMVQDQLNDLYEKIQQANAKLQQAFNAGQDKDTGKWIKQKDVDYWTDKLKVLQGENALKWEELKNLEKEIKERREMLADKPDEPDKEKEKDKDDQAAEYKRRLEEAEDQENAHFKLVENYNKLLAKNREEYNEEMLKNEMNFYDELDKLQTQKMEEQLKNHEERFLESLKIYQDVARDLSGLWTSTISEWINGAKTFRDAFDQMMADIVDAFMSMIAQIAAQKLVKSFFGDIVGVDLFKDLKLGKIPVGNISGVDLAGPGAPIAGRGGATVININAVDAASFEALARRNAGVITGVVWEAQQYGSAL